ncbi:MAG: hypothetical protein ISR65_14410 [Bacteriovoracaceae bacterium]|nr:hypothetical protein [Bacteriovoracaceae bacterium]
MFDENFDPQNMYERLKSLKNIAGRPEYDVDRHKQVQVHIRADKTIAPAKFLPDPLVPGGYKAHPQTIRALRPDIFMGSDSIDIFDAVHTCRSCQNELEPQFWKFCPYCGTTFL